ncbi:MAG: type II toxin-antitoxin system HigB family toxin [Dysgonomonas sp.]
MRIISRTRIKEYSKERPEAEIALNDWYSKTKRSDWENFSDLKKTFGSVDAVGNSNYVFNIKGNHFRLIARIFFEAKLVYILFIGTHAEYDKIEDCSEI